MADFERRKELLSTIVNDDKFCWGFSDDQDRTAILYLLSNNFEDRKYSRKESFSLDKCTDFVTHNAPVGYQAVVDDFRQIQDDFFLKRISKAVLSRPSMLQAIAEAEDVSGPWTDKVPYKLNDCMDRWGDKVLYKLKDFMDRWGMLDIFRKKPLTRYTLRARAKDAANERKKLISTLVYCLTVEGHLEGYVEGFTEIEDEHRILALAYFLADYKGGYNWWIPKDWDCWKFYGGNLNEILGQYPACICRHQITDEGYLESLDDYQNTYRRYLMNNLTRHVLNDGDMRDFFVNCNLRFTAFGHLYEDMLQQGIISDLQELSELVEGKYS